MCDKAAVSWPQIMTRYEKRGWRTDRIPPRCPYSRPPTGAPPSPVVALANPCNKNCCNNFFQHLFRPFNIFCKTLQKWFFFPFWHVCCHNKTRRYISTVYADVFQTWSSPLQSQLCQAAFPQGSALWSPVTSPDEWYHYMVVILFIWWWYYLYEDDYGDCGDWEPQQCFSDADVYNLMIFFDNLAKIKMQKLSPTTDLPLTDWPRPRGLGASWCYRI